MGRFSCLPVLFFLEKRYGTSNRQLSPAASENERSCHRQSDCLHPRVWSPFYHCHYPGPYLAIQIKKNASQQGDGIALAGLIAGYLGLVAVVAGIILAALGYLAMPAVSQMRNEAFSTISRANARMVHIALVTYETERGNPANSRDDLVPDYLGEPVLYIDPETQEELPFEYFTDRASIPFVLGSPRSFRGNRIVVYQDGSIEEIPEIEYLDRVGRAL